MFTTEIPGVDAEDVEPLATPVVELVGTVEEVPLCGMEEDMIENEVETRPGELEAGALVAEYELVELGSGLEVEMVPDVTERPVLEPPLVRPVELGEDVVLVAELAVDIELDVDIIVALELVVKLLVLEIEGDPEDEDVDSEF